MTKRDAYIRSSIHRLFRFWLVRGPLLGAVIFISLSPLDYVAAREHFALFLKYRLVGAAFLILLGLCATRVKGWAAMNFLAYLSAFGSAVIIEAMVLGFGGHQSTFYPGMVVLGVAIFGIYPAGTRFHIVSACGIYLIYLLPILAYDEITSFPYFAGANIFIISIFTTAVVLRHLNQRTLKQQFGLQFDLEEHQAGLEEVVEERTGELSAAIKVLREENRAKEDTERKLLEAVGDWRTTFDAAREMIVLLDRDMKIRKLNSAAARYLGLSFEEALGGPFLELLGEHSVPVGEHPLEKIRTTLSHAEAEMYHPGRDDWLMGVADPVLDGSGSLTGAVLMLHPINDIKQMRDQILSAKAEWEETFDVINDAITIHDNNFHIIRANRAAVDLLGNSMERILSRPCFELYHGSFSPPAACPSCSVRDSGRPCSSEIFEPHLGKHLEIKALPRLDTDGSIMGLVHVVRDITARKAAEQQHQLLQSQLQHSQKMESIGRLAGGVAHDFNNILFAMLGYNELAMSKLPDEHAVQKHLKVVQESGERAASLNHQLLAFSRKQVLDFQPVSLNATIRNMGKMLERLIGEDYSLNVVTDGQSRSIMADPGQIEQVIMNLVVNSRDAMSGGAITVKASDVELRQERRSARGNVPVGSYVVLEISDSGCGMGGEVQEHIFEPFYTTKKTGEGSGLGLSTVYGIVQQHEGAITVRSRPGKGTTVKVFLPAGEDQEIAEDAKTKDLPPHGKETILVVEDEPSVRQLVCDVMEPLGYTLLLAENGKEALKLIEKRKQRIDLLLSDVVMPAMNGWEFSKLFRNFYPEAKVIFMSGYTDDIISRHGVSASEEALLQKPVRPSVLARVVREVLDGLCRLST